MKSNIIGRPYYDNSKSELGDGSKKRLQMLYYLSLVNELGGINAYDFLVFQEGYHGNVVIKKAEKASDKGYMDYGVSARTGWITEKGIKFLEDNEKEDNGKD